MLYGHRRATGKHGPSRCARQDRWASASHFAHPPGQSPAGFQHEFESPWHITCKAVLAEWATTRTGVTAVHIEAWLADFDRRCDVQVTFDDGARIMIEARRSRLTDAQWINHHEGYRRHGIADVWLWDPATPVHRVVLTHGRQHLRDFDPFSRTISLLAGAAHSRRHRGSAGWWPVAARAAPRCRRGPPATTSSAECRFRPAMSIIVPSTPKRATRISDRLVSFAGTGRNRCSVIRRIGTSAPPPAPSPTRAQSTRTFDLALGTTTPHHPGGGCALSTNPARKCVPADLSGLGDAHYTHTSWQVENGRGHGCGH
ncbi:competence protein CoiA family protein [Nocardia sp. NBC_00881]|uniref:competence protein CoiA family protein n=1 Tax=Nocardia sp. NBC_00881 TaxID=2975995 RepID=UPI0038676658